MVLKFIFLICFSNYVALGVTINKHFVTELH